MELAVSRHFPWPRDGSGALPFETIGSTVLAAQPVILRFWLHGRRFLTILPKTRKEDGTGRAWIAGADVALAEIARRPGKKKDGSDQVYWATEAPSRSAEGYRIVWIRSSDKRAHDAAARIDRIERARAGLGALGDKITSLRCQMTTGAIFTLKGSADLRNVGCGVGRLPNTCSHAYRSLDRLVEVVEVPPSPQATSSRPVAANTTPAASHRCRHRHHLVEPRASTSVASPRALRKAMSSCEAL